MENTPESTRKVSLTALIVSAVLALLVSNLLTGLAVFFLTRPVLPPDAPVLYRPEEIFEQFAPSVCEITVGAEAGTGFLASAAEDADGRTLYIATAYHVVKDLLKAPAPDVTLQFYADAADAYRTDEIALCGYDTYHDIAVLSVSDKWPEKRRVAGLDAVNGNPATAQGLVAIGNMGGEGIAAFGGALSNPDKILDFGAETAAPLRYRPVYQVSADLNAGVSGGPIFDLYGNLAGIAAYQSPKDDGRPVVGVSFAIPACIAAPLIQKAVLQDETGEIHKIELYMDSADDIYFSDLRFAAAKADGGYQVTRIEGEAAPPVDLAGGWFQPDDMVVSIAGVAAEELTRPQVFGLLLAYANGSGGFPAALNPVATDKKLTFTVLRGGKILTVTYEKKVALDLT